MTRDAFEDRLNALLNEEHHLTPGLEQRIRNDLPAQDGLQRLIDWVATSVARAALTAAVPLAVGFLVGFDLDDATLDAGGEVITLAFVESFEEFDYE